MIDFDDIDDWASGLGTALSGCVPKSVGPALAVAAPEFIEEARTLLFRLTDRDEVIDATLAWIRSSTIAGYHGTRLTDTELASVLSIGLIPLKAENRRGRIIRALSPHPSWSKVANRLDGVIQDHGKSERAGCREGQVHLTLSKSGLTGDFNHYLKQGAEFDYHVAHALLGPEGVEMLGQDGEARLIRVAVPGTAALDAAHPHFKIDDLRARGDVPNIVNNFLKAWSYRLANVGFQCRTLKVDCGMVFSSAVPPDWIVDIETVAALKR